VAASASSNPHARARRPWRHLVTLWLSLSFVVFGPTLAARAADDPLRETTGSSVAALTARARVLKLADSRAWRALLHMPYGKPGKADSELYGRGFFLSPRGAHDPAAELDATLHALLAAPATPTDLPAGVTGVLARDREHPMCRFPARALWLSSQLEFGDAFTGITCPQLAAYFERMSARSVTLVFSGYHLAAPASAFGHVFLRLNKQVEAGQGRAVELLDQAIDFSAEVDTANPIAYAVKGLTGLFPGTYHAMPYFYKVREYNDFESRDLWEYDLDLSPDRVLLLVAHSWELGVAASPYFYLSGNCAYHVLSLLDAAAPRLQVAQRLGWPVLPVNSVKSVADTPGLVRQVRFRPSLRRQFRLRQQGLTGRERDSVAGLADNAELPLAVTPADRAAAVLDAAADLVDLRYAKQIVTEPDHPAHTLRRRLLERRSELLVPSPLLDETPPHDERPDRSHDTGRVGVGLQYQRGWLPVVDWRLTMHDFTDPPAGYPSLGQLEFLAVRFGWRLPQAKGFLLQRADFAHVASLQPIDRFEQRASWQFRVGVDRRDDRLCPTCHLATLDVAGGLTLATERRRLAFSLLADTALQAGPRVAAFWPYLPVGLLVGPRALVRLQLADSAVFTATSTVAYALNRRRGWLTNWDARLRVGINRSAAIGAEVSGVDALWRASAMLFLYY